MIKVETLGMLDIAKINPVLKSEEDVKNYSFLTADGILYLISNTVVGDDAYLKDVVIPAGDFLNGYQVDAWVGQKLVVDGKHIAFLSQLFVWLGERKINVVLLHLSGGDGIFPSHQFLQVFRQDGCRFLQCGLIRRIDNNAPLGRKTEGSFRSLPFPEGRDDLRTRVLGNSH